ncbi:MAG: hypothetical protein HLUCCA08_01260 [Rhodobacteraceae bacterium HLUCCA08]|nr:MAG: hypothetical protein HLUCCA08_01260 [Rhodobacteraceae bacterium HLUCCA08]
MRALIAVASVAVLGVAAWFVLLRDRAPSAETVLALILADNPEVIAEASGLEGCLLRLHGTRPTDLGLALADLRVDLSLYQLEAVRILPQEAGHAIYLADLDTDRARVAAAAERLVELLPAEVDGTLGAGGAEAVLASGGELSFRLGAELDAEGRPEVHPDGPVFHAFAEAVLEAGPAVTARITRVYEGPEPSAAALRLGEVALPNVLQVRLGSTEAAEAFGQALFSYQQAHCPV